MAANSFGPLTAIVSREETVRSTTQRRIVSAAQWLLWQRRWGVPPTDPDHSAMVEKFEVYCREVAETRDKMDAGKLNSGSLQK